MIAKTKTPHGQIFLARSFPSFSHFSLLSRDNRFTPVTFYPKWFSSFFFPAQIIPASNKTAPHYHHSPPTLFLFIMSDDADQPRDAAGVERELTRLWRAWRTVHEMCQDRVSDFPPLDKLVVVQIRAFKDGFEARG